MQSCVITRNFSHVPVTLLRTECLYGAIRRSILSLHYILLPPCRLLYSVVWYYHNLSACGANFHYIFN